MSRVQYFATAEKHRLATFPGDVSDIGAALLWLKRLIPLAAARELHREFLHNSLRETA